MYNKLNRIARRISIFVFIILIVFTMVSMPAFADPGKGQGQGLGGGNVPPGQQPGNPSGNPSGNPPPGPGGNPNQEPSVVNNYNDITNTNYTSNVNTTNNVNQDYTQYYGPVSQDNSSTEMTYINNTDITNNIIDNSQVLQAISDMQDSYLHTFMRDEAHYASTISMDPTIHGPVGGPESKVHDDAKLQVNANLSFNPKDVSIELANKEFSRFQIAVTSDKPIYLRVKSKHPDIKILREEIIIGEAYGVVYVPITVVFNQGRLWGNHIWMDSVIEFENVFGEKLDEVRVICKNKYGLNWYSSAYSDSDKFVGTTGIKKRNPASALSFNVVGSYNYATDEKEFGMKIIIDH